MIAKTTKWPFIDKRTIVRNKVNIWLISGICPPLLGSIWNAKDNPEVAAIFSPAKATAANKIVNKRPADSPRASSCAIIGKTSSEVRSSMGGTETRPIRKAASDAENTTRTGREIIRDPKKGADSKKAPKRSNKIRKINA